MRGSIASLWRHPVKGLTPERLASAALEAGGYFPNDRKYAVEVGPSGFDPGKPAFISKQRFTVLARFPSLARLKTRLDDATGVLHIGDAHGFGVAASLVTEDGREALARFLQAFLGDEAPAKLKVLAAPDGHRFTDNILGHVSVINLASLREVEKAIGRPVEPLRFRANVYVEGWPAWVEDSFGPETMLRLGGARLSWLKLITRCVATHVNLDTGERDIEMVDELRRHFGRDTLGNYFNVRAAGVIAEGAEALAA